MLEKTRRRTAVPATKRLTKRRNASSNDINWPGPGEPVEMIHALMAIAFGNAPLLARYLRETDPVYSGITNLIAFMLDPKGEKEEPPDGGDQADWCRTWRLKFERTGPGNLKNFIEIDTSRLHIGFYIDALIKKGEKGEAAKQKAVEQFGISLAHAKKALKVAREFNNYKRPSSSRLHEIMDFS